MDEHDIYCIRCGNPLNLSEAYYTRDDPDCEEALCFDYYNRFKSDRK